MRKISLFFTLFVLFASMVFAGGIHQDLQAAMDSNRGDHQIIVEMEDQFDMAAIANRSRSSEAALNELFDLHAQSQSAVRELLSVNRSVSDVQYLNIVNAVTLTADNATIEQLASTPGVANIYLDETQIMISPMEISETRGTNWGLGWVKAERAHNIGAKGEGVTVFVLDTGVDLDHYMFSAGQVNEALSKSFISSEPDADDGHGHGTHCATTIAGSAGDGANVGVAPKATIVAVKVLSRSGSGSWSGVAGGVDHVAQCKADGLVTGPIVASMSLGGRDSASSNVVETAVQNAIAAGIHFAIAAGNSGPRTGTVGTPGCVPQAVTVGAHSNSGDGTIASFSSRGLAYKTKWENQGFSGDVLTKPDVSAPGVNIYAGWMGNGTRTISGTSMATPHVAGGMALVLSEYPDATPQQIKDAVTKTNMQFPSAASFKKDATYGWGRMDVGKMVDLHESGQLIK